MPYLSRTAGQMIIHIGVAPGLPHEEFIPARLKALETKNPSDIVVMHMPAEEQDPTLCCTYLPETDVLWNDNVLQSALLLNPRLVIFPRLFHPDLEPELHQKFLANIKALLHEGLVVETSLSAVEIARANDLLIPHVPVPQANAITGDFLRAHVGDYVLHDMTPHDIMAYYYTHALRMPAYLEGHESTLFNTPNLIRLRELMLRFVSSHNADIARSLNPTKVTVQSPIAWLNWRKTLPHMAVAVPLNFAWLLIVNFLWSRLGFTLPAVSLLLVAGPVVTALYVNPITALVVTLMSFTAFPPIFTRHTDLIPGDPSGLITFGTFLAVTLATSFLVARHHIRQQQKEDQALKLQALFRLSYDMAYTDTIEDAVASAITNLKRTFSLPAVLLNAKGELWRESETGLTLTEEEKASALQAMRTSTTMVPQMGQQWLWCPLVAKQAIMGVIGLKMGPAPGASSLDTVQMLRSYSDILSTALRRAELRQVSEEATQEAERESLRATLLSAVSHDLKTPLVSIIGSLSTLRAVGAGLPEDYRAELIQTANEEAERLYSIIHNVLELTRLESGSVKPNLVDVELSSIIQSALSRAARYYPRMQVSLTEKNRDLPWIKADPLLLEEVLYNLMDNAAKYAGLDAKVTLDVKEEANHVFLLITDNGPGIPEAEREKVFSKYYRAAQQDNRNAGSGLGLAICRAIMEACNASIWIEERADKKKGTVMVLKMPKTTPAEVKETSHD